MLQYAETKRISLCRANFIDRVWRFIKTLMKTAQMRIKISDFDVQIPLRTVDSNCKILRILIVNEDQHLVYFPLTFLKTYALFHSCKLYVTYNKKWKSIAEIFHFIELTINVKGHNAHCRAWMDIRFRLLNISLYSGYFYAFWSKFSKKIRSLLIIKNEHYPKTSQQEWT